MSKFKIGDRVKVKFDNGHTFLATVRPPLPQGRIHPLPYLVQGDGKRGESGTLEDEMTLYEPAFKFGQIVNYLSDDQAARGREPEKVTVGINRLDPENPNATQYLVKLNVNDDIWVDEDKLSEIVYPPCYCANCDWEGPENELNAIKDYHMRVSEDDDVEPDGECPECGCLAYVKSIGVSVEIGGMGSGQTFKSLNDAAAWIAEWVRGLNPNDLDDVKIFIGAGDDE